MTDVTVKMLQNSNERNNEYKDIQRKLIDIQDGYVKMYNPSVTIQKMMEEVVVEPPPHTDEEGNLLFPPKKDAKR